MFRTVHALALPTLGFAFVAIACVEDVAPTASGDDPIRGGTPEKGYAAVGIIRMQDASFCTGTLIGPDVVLTAAHCLRATAKTFHLGAGKPVADYRSTEAIDTMTKSVIAEQVGYPAFAEPRGGSCPSAAIDVALLRLATPIADVAPERIDYRAPLASEKCTTVGFGNASGSFHLKRSATQKMRQERETAYGFEAFRISTEGGDSGGPLFCDGAIVAVNSCGNAPDWFARLDRARPWIDAMLADWDPAAAAKLPKM